MIDGMRSDEEGGSKIVPLRPGLGQEREARRSQDLESRVLRACQSALAEDRLVTPIDMLGGLGWLTWNDLEHWRQGRLDYLEQRISTKPSRVAQAFRIFEDWARGQGLTATESGLDVSRTRDRRPLRCTENGDPDRERAYRTQWVLPGLSDRERERVTRRDSRPPDLVVVSPIKDWECSRCAGTGDFLIMENGGPVCMECADMDHLVLLPSGDATLSRRAKAASGLSAVVVRFSRTRKRYERQGVLVEQEALAQAEAECMAHQEKRSRRRR
jgi:hypothetical protein